MIVQGEERTEEARRAAQGALFQWEVAVGKAPRDAVAWDPVMIAGRIPQQSPAALAFNAVVAPGFLLALALTPLDALSGTGWPSVLGWVLGACMVWFLIGRWVDEQRFEGERPRRNRVERIVRAYGVVAAGLSPLLLLLFTWAYLFDRHGSFHGSNLFLFAIVFFWSAAGTAVTWSRAKRIRPDSYTG